ncbi:hypothetical protein AB1Y20_019080 [Prymnesium parvum]|uniref:Calpain catalytic domain-containing protein n=1 Tax=Prymnesium parvum TaxID=97485 RepID=A0AB34JT76_PRYPA
MTVEGVPLARTKSSRCVGCWRNADRTAGGSLAEASFLHNPQFQLELSCRQQDVRIAVVQASGSELYPVGVVVLQAAERSRRRSTLGHPGGPLGYQALTALYPSVPKAAKRISSMFKLERSDLPFLIVPHTFEAGCEANFVLEVSSNFPCTLQPLPSAGSRPATPLRSIEEKPTPPVGELPIAASDKATLQRVLDECEPSPYEDPAFEVADQSELGWELMRAYTLMHSSDTLDDQVELAREVELLPCVEWRLNDQAANWIGAVDGVLGGLAVLASYPHVLERCFPFGFHLEESIVAVRLWQFDRWVLTITDDRLPSKDGHLLLTGSKEDQPVLLGMLFKAYAKAVGGFTFLSTIQPIEALVDFTGGAAQRLDVFLGGDPTRLDTSGLDRVWGELGGWLKNSLVGCMQTTRARRVVTRGGIRADLTYVLLDAVHAGSERLLCLRCPWKGCSWEGRWRAGAPEWMRQDASNLTPLHYLQRRQSAYAFAAVSDRAGVFWLSLRDFCSLFDEAFACSFFPESSPHAMIADQWVGESAGGCLDFASWRGNPQYLLNLSHDSRVHFVLSQSRQRARKQETQGLCTIGICALRGVNRRRRLTVKRQDIVGQCPLSEIRDACISIDLPRTTSTQPHVIVPYTLNPGEENEFVLSVYTEAHFKLQPLESTHEWHHTVFTSEWTARSGGCPNPENRWWRRNPQWSLSVSAPTTVILSLELAKPSAEPHFAIGCILMRSSGLSRSSLLAEDVVIHSGFVPHTHVSVQTTLLPEAQPYILMASTFEPGQQAAFSLHIFSDLPLEPKTTHQMELHSKVDTSTQKADGIGSKYADSDDAAAPAEEELFETNVASNALLEAEALLLARQQMSRREVHDFSSRKANMCSRGCSIQ